MGVKAKTNSAAKKVSWYFSRSLSIQPGVCIYSLQSNTMSSTHIEIYNIYMHYKFWITVVVHKQSKVTLPSMISKTGKQGNICHCPFSSRIILAVTLDHSSGKGEQRVGDHKQHNGQAITDIHENM